jgi:DNA-binding HxlR family transcriptional regulator
MTSVADTLNAISNNKALALFNIIASGRIGSSMLRNKTKLTRKQYYSRMSALLKAGLVKRKSGRYNLTAFGKVVYDAQATIENAINNYWKLKAVDSIEISDELPKEEFNKIVDILIDNHQIKDRLIGKIARENDLSANNSNKKLFLKEATEKHHTV